MKTRIVEINDKFYVQQRVFLLWSLAGILAVHGELYAFDTLEDAQKARDRHYGPDSNMRIVG